jgi:transcriptional regulator GlxA family with amidase domain
MDTAGKHEAEPDRRTEAMTSVLALMLIQAALSEARGPKQATAGLVRGGLARGGLAPASLRRVHEYVDRHLDRTISLGELAKLTGLSVFHFARSFKQSQGTTPHRYVMQRRIERARDMLVTTDLPLCEIAFAAGFADQSHLARHFRQQVGVPPGYFRRSTRGQTGPA